MTISVGDKLPEVTLIKATAEGPQAVKSSEYFAGKKIALFSVPGAFTPTCSAKHLPGFVEKAADLKAKGVDEIVGTAVNDAFVMGAWTRPPEVTTSPCSPTAMPNSSKRSASPWTARASASARAASVFRW